MLAVSSAALMAAVMQRSFGVFGGPDFCSWMSSPLCDWKEFPEAIRTKVARVLKKEKARGIKQKWRIFLVGSGQKRNYINVLCGRKGLSLVDV